MKPVFALLVLVLLGLSTSAQTPQSFRYQAVSRDNSGNILANQSVSFKISILIGSVAGTAVYTETHTGLSTNAYGLVELEIGKGTPATGVFSAINWGSNSYFIKVEMDPAGGSAYQVLSTSQLLSVPYALHAKTVEQISDNSVTSAKIADGAVNSVDLAANSVTSSKIADGTIAAADVASNAITTVKVANSAITSEKIADGAITGAKIAQQSATSGQVLKWDGTTWAPASDETGIESNPFVSSGGITRNTFLTDDFVFGSVSLDYIVGAEENNSRMFFNKSSGSIRAGETFDDSWDEVNTGLHSAAFGFNTRASGIESFASGRMSSATGLYSTAIGVSTVASGMASTAVGGATKATGQESTAMGYYTVAAAKSSVAIGRFNLGSGNGTSWIETDPVFEIGIGSSDTEKDNAMTVLKNGKVGIGTATPTEKLEVVGQIKITGGSPGSGKVLTSDAAGLASWQTAAVGLTLPYESSCSSTNPAFSIIQTGGGTGIYGYINNSSSTASGVTGTSNARYGTGVSGYVFSEMGEGVGVKGRSDCSEGSGIRGYALSTIGQNYGVYGETKSSSGYSGYFTGGKFYISGNTGIGTENPTAKLDVAGQVKITGGSPGANKVLTSDANGLATWQAPANSTFSSSGGITSNSPITDHFVVGSSVMDDVSGTADDIRLFFNKTKGAFRAGRTASSEWNNANVGQYSAAFGDNIKASGPNSFASGVGSVAAGSVATAMGYFVNATAMLSTAVGSCNVGSGTKEMWVDTDPIFEIGNGTMDAARSNAFTVLKNGNTGIGTHTPSQKLHIRGSAAGNAVLFIQPNKWTSAGDYGELRLGDANHYIRGEYAKGMTFNDADKFVFKGGNMGIGTESPAAKLDVSASQGPNIIIRDSDGGAGRPGIQFVNNDIHFIGADDTGNEVFGIYSQYGNNRTYAARLNIHGPATANWGKYIGFTHDGNNGRIDTDAGYLVLDPAGNRVGVETDAPTQSLDVNGNARFRYIGSGAYSGVVNRTTDGTLTTSTSDIRLKENVKTLNGSLDKVMQLRGVSFTWKSNPEYGTRIGFIAQEFEKVIPELVFTNEVDGYKGINYAEVTAVLVEAIKELKTENDLLKKRLEQIEVLIGYIADK